MGMTWSGVPTAIVWRFVAVTMYTWINEGVVHLWNAVNTPLTTGCKADTRIEVTPTKLRFRAMRSDRDLLSACSTGRATSRGWI